MPPRPLTRLRRICLDLPETSERLSHGAPTFFVRQKRTFVMFVEGEYYTAGGGQAMWCAAPDGVQGELVEEEPDRFFVPPYVGHRGWLGVRLDVEVDWDEIAALVEEAYRRIAPKTLIKQLDALDALDAGD